MTSWFPQLVVHPCFCSSKWFPIISVDHLPESFNSFLLTYGLGFTALSRVYEGSPCTTRYNTCVADCCTPFQLPTVLSELEQIRKISRLHRVWFLMNECNYSTLNTFSYSIQKSSILARVSMTKMTLYTSSAKNIPSHNYLRTKSRGTHLFNLSPVPWPWIWVLQAGCFIFVAILKINH